MDLSKIYPLSLRYPDIKKVLACSVTATFPKSLLLEGETPVTLTHLAIWDTGAENSAITELAAKKLNLAPTGKKNMSGLGGYNS